MTSLDFLVPASHYINVECSSRRMRHTPPDGEPRRRPEHARTLDGPGLESAPDRLDVLQSSLVLYMSARRTARPAPVKERPSHRRHRARHREHDHRLRADADAEVLKFVQEAASARSAGPDRRRAPATTTAGAAGRDEGRHDRSPHEGLQRADPGHRPEPRQDHPRPTAPTASQEQAWIKVLIVDDIQTRRPP